MERESTVNLPLYYLNYGGTEEIEFPYAHEIFSYEEAQSIVDEYTVLGYDPNDFYLSESGKAKSIKDRRLKPRREFARD